MWPGSVGCSQAGEPREERMSEGCEVRTAPHQPHPAAEQHFNPSQQRLEAEVSRNF